MSFLEHLEELRGRLIRSLLALVIGAIVCWNFRTPIFRFLTQPLRQAQPGIQFIAISPAEALLLYMKMAVFVGIFVAMPYVLYQVWAFVSPGLYPRERRYVLPFILFGSLFFIAGGLFGHYVLFPMTFGFLAAFGGDEIKLMPRVAEYFSFYSWFLLGIGLVFQTPVVIFVLSRIGLVTPGFLLRQFKYAVLIAFIVAAVITPTPDAVTQTALALPMLGLYLLGVLVARLFGRPRRAAQDDAASQEPPSAGE
jgi:sec-independent protein translocase protein TatC